MIKTRIVYVKSVTLFLSTSGIDACSCLSLANLGK